MVDVQVRDLPEEHRYHALVDGKVAGVIFYRDAGDDRIMRHTEVATAFEGKGVGSALARAALDDVRAKGKQVRPNCPFVASWIERHPDYRDLVHTGS
jgi:predicted GNAT family acetyltransferase